MLRPRAALVLGAGSARGMAHLGVLQVLQEEEIPVDIIVGCSSGAIAGALYASGADLYMMEKLLMSYPVMKQLADISVPKSGFVKGEKVFEFLRLLTKDQDFNELPVKLAVVATDLEKAEQVVFTEGKIAPAVRASISIPGVFCPYDYCGMTLVDGAVIERLPIGVAKSMGAEFIIGVDVKGSRGGKVKNVLDVIMQSIEIMEDEIFRRTEHTADVLIQPEVGHIGSFKFDLAEEAVRLGRQAAKKHLTSIKRTLLPNKYTFMLKEDL